MSLKNLKHKKSYSPARMIIVDETQPKPVQSLQSLKSRKSLMSVPSLHPEQLSNARSSPKVYFSVKHRPEIYLFEPPILNKQLIKKSNRFKDRRGKKGFFGFDSPAKPSRQLTRMLEENQNLLKVIEKHENSRKLETEVKFFSFVKNNYFEELEMLLVKHPNLVFSCDSIGMTGLHWAAKRNLTVISKILIKYGSDIQKKDILNRSSLDIARKRDHTDLVHTFSEHLTRQHKTPTRFFTN